MKRRLRLTFGFLAVLFFLWAVERAAHFEQARASGRLSERGSELAVAGARSDAPAVKIATRSESLYQGKPIRWWARRAVQARKDANKRGHTIRRLQSAQLAASAHFFAWLENADCIFRHERGRDGWETRTGNGYYGGMQADLDFQRTYAPDLLRRYDATADRWPWYAQLQMAYRGWLFRGWQPWPKTSRACGLR